jgi:hypothetical protein
MEEEEEVGEKEEEVGEEEEEEEEDARDALGDALDRFEALGEALESSFSSHVTSSWIHNMRSFDAFFLMSLRSLEAIPCPRCSDDTVSAPTCSTLPPPDGPATGRLQQHSQNLHKGKKRFGS